MRSAFLLIILAAAACGPSAGAKRAQAFLDRGDYPGAAQSADAELGRSPGDASLHRIRLRAALGMGDARGAVDHYRAWREGKGDDLGGLRTMAMTTLWQGIRSSAPSLRLQTIRAIERLEVEAFAHDVGERLGVRPGADPEGQGPPQPQGLQGQEPRRAGDGRAPEAAYDLQRRRVGRRPQLRPGGAARRDPRDRCLRRRGHRAGRPG